MRLKGALFFAALSISTVGQCQFEKLLIQKTGKSKKWGTTYRIFVQLKEEGDQLLVVFGDKDHPMNISSSESFYQFQNGASTAAEISSKNREEAFKNDSWITLSSDLESHPSLQFMGMKTLDFEQHGKALSSGSDGAWYILPTAQQSVCRSDKRILIAQLTTKGKLFGTVNLMGKTKQGESWIQHNIPIEF